MNEFRRNFIVGVFVIGAGLVLGTMIILFGAFPQFLSHGYNIGIYFPTAGPIQNDDPVYLNGRQIGQVKWIEFRTDIRQGVKILCRIEEGYKISSDAQPLIKEQSMGFGKPAILIEVGPDNSPKALPFDGTGILQGSVAKGIAEVLPKGTLKKVEDATTSLTQLADALKPVADDLHVLFKAQTLPSETATQPTTRPHPLANVSTAIQRLDQALKGFNDVLANPENKNNLNVMIRNFKIVSENGVNLTRKLNDVATSMDTKIDKVAAGLIQNTDKLSQLFDKLNDIAAKMSAGQGAAGKFFNDPELYDALTFTARKLTAAVDDLRALLVQWQEKGLKIQGGVLGK